MIRFVSFSKSRTKISIVTDFPEIPKIDETLNILQLKILRNIYITSVISFEYEHEYKSHLE